MGSNPVYGGTLIDKKDSRGRLIARGAYWDEGARLNLYGICSLWPKFRLPCPIRDVCIGVGFAKKNMRIFLGRRKGYTVRFSILPN